MTDSSRINSPTDWSDESTGWPTLPDRVVNPVPQRYWGVWSRTLLETPELRDTTTLVRWMQLGQWHVDLRVPADPAAALQGFSGITQVTQIGAQEMCTWQRLVDYQPPRTTVDEGWMVFKTPEQVEESGIHGVYFEVWDRLPGSTGRRIALAEPQRADRIPSARIFMSGDYLMRVRPAEPLAPKFEISFGRFVGGRFFIEASTLWALSGNYTDLSLSKISDGDCDVCMDTVCSRWEILEWVEA
jgi:hypothetical protein